MDETTRKSIRHIFLSPRPNFPLITAAGLLAMTLKELKREIETGSIVAVSTRLGQRVAREELVAAAMGIWEQAAIEEALGADAAAVLPDAIRLVELRARVPRYQRDMLRYLAERNGTSVDDVLTRELEDVACAHAEELAAAVPGFDTAMIWPERAAGNAG
jgi:lambda repressor-like predicted transcriptional regulator